MCFRRPGFDTIPHSRLRLLLMLLTTGKGLLALKGAMGMVFGAFRSYIEFSQLLDVCLHRMQNASHRSYLISQRLCLTKVFDTSFSYIYGTLTEPRDSAAWASGSCQAGKTRAACGETSKLKVSSRSWKNFGLLPVDASLFCSSLLTGMYAL